MRKKFNLVIWMILLTAAIPVFAQDDSGLEVLKHEWKPNYRDPRLTAPSLTTEPQRIPQPDLIKNSDGSTSINPDSRRVNPEGGPDPVTPTVLPAEKSIRIILELKSNSPKRIVSVEADYVLYDRDKKEYFRYRLVSDKPVKPGETVKIKKSITAKDKQFSGSTSTAKLFFVTPTATKVEIVSIKYDDGTVWAMK